MSGKDPDMYYDAHHRIDQMWTLLAIQTVKIDVSTGPSAPISVVQ